MRHLLRLITAGAIVLTTIGCSHSSQSSAPPTVRSSTSSNTASDVLAAAKQILDQTSAVHFTLTGSNLPSGHNVLQSATGDAVHPAQFRGVVTLIVGGLPVSVAAVSVGGHFFAKLPGSSDYTQVDPAAYGLSDPGHLISTTAGVSVLLTAGSGTTYKGLTREGSDVLDEYTTSLPGDLVGRILTIADPAAKVQARFAIDKTTKQLRRAELDGPFYAKGTHTKYSILFSNYGEGVTISTPPTP